MFVDIKGRKKTYSNAYSIETIDAHGLKIQRVVAQIFA
jgi:hypothetical protein